MLSVDAALRAGPAPLTLLSLGGSTLRGSIHEMSWRIDRQAPPIGSRLLEARLSEALQKLSSRYGIEAKPKGRHQTALNVLKRWNESDELIDNENEDELRQIAEAHRLAWETFLITVAALEDRRNPLTFFTSEKINTFLGGDFISEGRVTEHRDTQFELTLAARLRLSGVSVTRGEPDMRIFYGAEEVGVAAKRICSSNIDQVQKHARKAAKQIVEQGLCGWIALNLDSRFRKLRYPQHESDLLHEFSSTFNEVAPALERPATKQHVLGFIMLGYVFGWEQPATGGVPSLHWTTPLRWFRLADNPEQRSLFEQFVNGVSTRWAARRRTLASGDFIGLL
ncbi:MAG: hypothetical protein ACJ8GN_08960 [Longimicrobiaceae bacterium]